MQDLFLKLYAALKDRADRNEGQSMAEYAMAVGLIALGCVAGEAAIATNVNHIFVTLATTITNGVLLH
jgi:Flp pilus assembly pilin Flp